MAEEIGFENGRNSNFEGLVTLTLTLDAAIQHTVMHHSSTSTYIPNFIEIEETFCGRTDGRTYGHFSPSNIIRSTFGSRPNNSSHRSQQESNSVPPRQNSYNSDKPKYNNIKLQSHLICTVWDMHSGPMKTAHYSPIIILQLLKIKWNNFHQNVQKI